MVVSSAAAEDEEGSEWAVETWATRIGSARTFSVAPEYAFTATTSLQLELNRVVDRGADGSLSAVSLEFKHLFNHIARDGYGWGLVASVGAFKRHGAAARRDEWGLRVPLTVQLGDGDALLHVNAGFVQLPHERRQPVAALALEGEVWKRTVLFGEVARAADAKLLHAGVRYWFKRDKLAIDFSLPYARGDGGWQQGATLGIGWYSL